MREVPKLSCGVLLLSDGPSPEGGSFDVLLLEIMMAANTHPITVPVNTESWATNIIRVVDWIPINVGSLLCRRK